MLWPESVRDKLIRRAGCICVLGREPFTLPCKPSHNCTNLAAFHNSFSFHKRLRKGRKYFSYVNTPALEFCFLDMREEGLNSQPCIFAAKQQASKHSLLWLLSCLRSIVLDCGGRPSLSKVMGSLGASLALPVQRIQSQFGLWVCSYKVLSAQEYLSPCNIVKGIETQLPLVPGSLDKVGNRPCESCSHMCVWLREA